MTCFLFYLIESLVLYTRLAAITYFVIKLNGGRELWALKHISTIN